MVQVAKDKLSVSTYWLMHCTLCVRFTVVVVVLKDQEMAIAPALSLEKEEEEGEKK